MFRSIFSFEVHRWYRSTATYVYFILLFTLTFLLGTAIGGTFPSISIGAGAGGDKVFVNSPVAIAGLLNGVNSYLGMVIIVAIIGNSVLKDFSSNTYQLLFTTPVSKFNYLFGRFSGALFVSLILLMAPALGLMTAYAMPWINQDMIGLFMMSPYVQSYLYTTLPNALLAGAIFFAVSVIARDVFFIWVFLIIFFVVIGVSNSFFSTLEKQEIAALLDPFGMQASRMLTRHWNPYEKNHNPVTLQGILLYNRLLWLGISIGILIVGYVSFSFSTAPRTLFRWRKKGVDTAPEKTEFKRIGVGSVGLSFGTGNALKNLWSLAVNECRTIIRNTYFRIILLFGVVLLLLVSTQLGKMYDTTTFPVTSQVITYFYGTLTLFIVVLTIIFSGELVWKARDVRMSNILDATPVPNWVFYISKLIGLFFMQAILVSIIIVAGVIVQTFKGYTNYEIGLYIRYVYGFILPDFWLLAIVALFVQTLVKNRYIGFFIVTLFYIWNTFFAMLVLKHNLFVFSSDPGIVYSEMNGFGHTVYPYIIYKLYWGALAVCLATISSLLWARGSEDRLSLRWNDARAKSNRTAWASLIVLGVVFFTCGGFIYYNTNTLNHYETSYAMEKGMAEFEKKFKKYENSPQPTITDVSLNVDIFPKERDIVANGYYVLQNKTNVPIDSVHINYINTLQLDIRSFGRPHSLVLNDSENGFRIYKLTQPLQPGESVKMTFTSKQITKGFEHNFSGLSTALYNGTFVNNQQFLPNIGYDPGSEMSNNKDRKEHGLPFRRTSLPIGDTTAYVRNIFTRNADFINFEATVSTSPDQMAIAPGYLQKEWTQNGRRYFSYKMDSPILNFYSFLSADYKVKKEKWQGVNLEIYYQKGHEYNLDRMMKGVKKALTYYTANFSPYQHKQVRILEFPSYSSFAQSFPNTIPFSESIGFIADVAGDEENVDYPFYVTAHEVAHQWFAHQVTGADVEGSNVLSETLAQYGAIRVLEQEYGADKLRKFLKYEADKFLSGRAFENEREKPLAYADMGQGYILYQKGGIVMNALSKYLGEDSVNNALKRFLQQYAFKARPYPTTLALVKELKQAAPDSMKYLVTDMFERITIYDNKINEAKTKKTADGNYVTEFTIEANKYDIDTTGKNNPIAFDDYIDVGVMSKDKLLAVQRFKIKKGTTNLTITSKTEPDKVRVDPNYLLIDKDLKNNEVKIEKKSS